MKVPIEQTVGLVVACPDHNCGAPSTVKRSDARPAPPGGLPPPVGMVPNGYGQPAVTTDGLWFILHCPRTGRIQLRKGTLVEVIAS